MPRSARARPAVRIPSAEPLRRELRGMFREQRGQISEYLRTGRKDWAGDLTAIVWPDLRLGALKESERFTPLLTAIWDDAGSRFNARVELDPDAWEVTNPHTQAMIEQAALDFCESTNESTSLELNEALARTRQELIEGVVTQGEALPKLVDRVMTVFDKLDKAGARRIAQTETSRAVHAAQEQAAIESGVVAGWEWLLSSDACPLCQTVARRTPKVQLGQPFAVVGDHPSYAQVRFPPLHPHCNCTVLEVLRPEYGGEPAQWSATLHQPVPEDQDYPGDTKAIRRKWRWAS